MIRVELAWYEVALAHDVTARRIIESGRNGDQHRDAAKLARTADQYHRALTGCAGELAAAKGLGLYWPGSVNTYHGPDLLARDGRPLGVRTRTLERDEPGLCIKPDDDPRYWYVLVVGEIPTFTVIGTIRGDKGRRDEWVSHSGGNRVWYVPQSELHPAEAPKCANG